MADPEEIDIRFKKEELRAAFDGPAPVANRFIVSIMPDGIRIGFILAKAEEGPFEYSSAVSLNFDDAQALSLLINKMLNLRETGGVEPGKQ